MYMYRPTLQSYINVQSCEFEWGHLQLWIYSVVLCQLGNISQWIERVLKFLPEVIAVMYACNGWGDVISLYVLVKQQAVGNRVNHTVIGHLRKIFSFLRSRRQGSCWKVIWNIFLESLYISQNTYKVTSIRNTYKNMIWNFKI